MKFSSLLAGVEGARISGANDPEIVSVCCDSRECAPGSLFVALSGAKEDGARFIAQAVERGAAGIVCGVSAEVASLNGCALAVVDDPRLALARLAAAINGHPARRLRMLGVTGTNGKTTTAYLLRHIINSCGGRCGMLGTIEYDTVSERIAAPLTTPQSTDFQAALARMLAAGADSCVAELSSHALEQRRVLGSDFACAIFTNLTRDHLDYHKTVENYAAAKKLLFDGLREDAAALVNSADPYAAYMVSDCRARVLRYGAEERDDFRICRADYSATGTHIVLQHAGEAITLNSPLVGSYNVFNVAGALAAAVACGLDRTSVVRALETFAGVPGRLEMLRSRAGFSVFVDYAHTPDALGKALTALRPLTKGRLIVVFGCGGDRDRGKRPLMGQAACALADVVYVTEDNPRTEDSAQIFEDIMSGCGTDGKVRLVQLRQEAINQALGQAREGDIVLVAGKGHEDYQIVGGQKFHFSDREVVLAFAGMAES